MKRATLMLATLTFLLGAWGVQARADIIYSNLVPGNPLALGNGEYVIAGPTSGDNANLFQGVEFTPTFTSTLSSIELPSRLGSGTNSEVVTIRSDASGVPGTVLESFSFVNDLTTSANTLLSANSILNPTLSAGTSYWFVVQPGASDTQIDWYFNGTDTPGTQAVTYDGGSNWSFPYSNENPPFPVGAFQVDGTPAISTPEPSGIAIFGLSVVCLAGGYALGRRKRALAAM